jgi:RNA polymerase sigma-70 factor (ECF subfamily)
MADDQKFLLRQARSLDQRALAEIYNTYSTELYGYALRLLGDPDIAEDCVAETFTRFLKALHTGKGPDKYLRAYLYRIAHNWIADSYRGSPQECLALEESMENTQSRRVEVQVDQNLLAAELRNALFQLTPDQRQVIMLVFIEGWQKAEVAAALGKPVGAVKSLQHRALKTLKRILASTEHEASYEIVGKLVRNIA